MNNQKKENMQKALFMLYRYLMQEESNWVRHRGLKRMLYYQGQGVTDALNLRKHAQRKGDIHKTIKLLQRQEILLKKTRKLIQGWEDMDKVRIPGCSEGWHLWSLSTHCCWHRKHYCLKYYSLKWILKNETVLTYKKTWF